MTGGTMGDCRLKYACCHIQNKRWSSRTYHGDSKGDYDHIVGEIKKGCDLLIFHLSFG